MTKKPKLKRFRYTFQSREQNFGINIESDEEDEDEILKSSKKNPDDFIIIKKVDLINDKVLFDAFRGII